MPESAQDQTSNLSDVAKRIKRLEREVRMAKGRSRVANRLQSESNTVGVFTKVDPRVTVHTISGTEGDGTYGTTETIDFTSAIPFGMKKAWVHIVVYGADIFAFNNKYSIGYTPAGWTNELIWTSTKLVDVNVEDEFVTMMPLGDDLTGSLRVMKIDNSAGDAWSYTFSVFGYE